MISHSRTVSVKVRVDSLCWCLSSRIHLVAPGGLLGSPGHSDHLGGAGSCHPSWDYLGREARRPGQEVQQDRVCWLPDTSRYDVPSPQAAHFKHLPGPVVEGFRVWRVSRSWRCFTCHPRDFLKQILTSTFNIKKTWTSENRHCTCSKFLCVSLCSRWTGLCSICKFCKTTHHWPGQAPNQGGKGNTALHFLPAGKRSSGNCVLVCCKSKFLSISPPFCHVQVVVLVLVFYLEWPTIP